MSKSRRKPNPLGTLKRILGKVNWTDRVLQIILGTVVLLSSGGAGLYQKGTDGGHEDFATYRMTTSVNTEARRLAANEDRLKKLHPAMRLKVAAVIRDMESHGYRPYIDQNVHRTAAEQLALYKAGRTTVTYSYHNVTASDGTPQSLAADLPDYVHGWSPPRSYWLLLASSAKAHGLDSGIYFGLSTKAKAADLANLKRAIANRNWNYKGGIGWDPSHCEWHGISLAQAKRGVRPKAADLLGDGRELIAVLIAAVLTWAFLKRPRGVRPK